MFHRGVKLGNKQVKPDKVKPYFFSINILVSQIWPNSKVGKGLDIAFTSATTNAIMVMNIIIKMHQLHLMKMAIQSANKSNIQH